MSADRQRLTVPQWLGLVVAGTVLLLLLGPWFGAPNERWEDVWNLAHVPAGALLALGLRTSLRGTPLRLIGLGLVVGLGLVELVQGQLGRFPSWGDWLSGSLGGVAALAWGPGWRQRARAAGCAAAAVVVAVPLWVGAVGQQATLVLWGRAPAGWWTGIAQEATPAAGSLHPSVHPLSLDGKRYGGVAWPVRGAVAATATTLRLVVVGSPAGIPEVVLRLETATGVRHYRGHPRSGLVTVHEWSLLDLPVDERRAVRRVTVFFPEGEGEVTLRASWRK